MSMETTFAMNVVTLATRLWTGIMLLAFYALEGVYGAWFHIWQEQPWSLVDAAIAHAVPSPVALLATAFGILCLSSLGLIFGLLTRFNAFLILVVLAVTLYFLRTDLRLLELTLVYMLGPFVILLAGSGSWALDSAMGRKRPQNRR